MIRDPVAGDKLTVGVLPGGITQTGDGTTMVALIGIATTTFADFQAALAAIRFSNPTNDNPTNNSRHVDVTVSDGLKDSAVATTTVQVIRDRRSGDTSSGGRGYHQCRNGNTE